MDFLTDVVNKRVFLILSNSLGPLMLPYIDEIPQLDSIYIYSMIENLDQQ